MKWILESNRPKHFLLAIPCGFIGALLSGILGGILFVLGLSLGMEFKDKQYGGKFDLLDILATILGGVIGVGLEFLIFCFLF